MADGGHVQRHDFVPDVDNTRALRDALGCFATGVTLVTIDVDGAGMGFVANSFSAVSLDPPLVLWSPSRASRRFRYFAKAQHFAIHILDRNAQGLIGRFGSNGAGFEGLTASRNDDGVPVLDGALARFDCQQHSTHDGGDHLIILGRVLRVSRCEGEPLIFSQGAYGAFASQMRD